MQRPTIKTLKPLLALGLVTALSACSSSEDDGVETTQEENPDSPNANAAIETSGARGGDNSRKGASSQDIDSRDRGGRRDKARNRNKAVKVIDGREVRSYDGSNNNPDHPDWGASFEPLQRLAPVDYSDGIAAMAGLNRPSARLVSNLVNHQAPGESIPNTAGGSDFVWQWGQFIDHDLDLTDGAEEDANIAVPAGDIHFDPNNTGSVSIRFSRALYDAESGIDGSNPRQQENEITSWLDGSMIYGSDDERALALRVDEQSPYLMTSDARIGPDGALLENGGLLPKNSTGLGNANGFIEDTQSLYLAGDVRANEQLGLTVMHTLFIREHNRLAGIIGDSNPDATAEEIFQQARRLVIAMIQHITYADWLPVLIGGDGLGDYPGYDGSVNPTIYNEFSVAAFRLGHSMLNEQLLRLDAQGNPIAEGHVALADAFFAAPRLLREAGDIDPVLRGLASQPHQRIDAKVVNAVRNFLFGQPGSGGLDLASLNIQRGRDHGVPSLNGTRQALGLPAHNSFTDITSDPELQAGLLEAYGDIDEVDLWVGGLAEDPVGDSQLGELFQAILARQFTELRAGDRFWYERHLTDEEIRLVEETTLADIINRNTSVSEDELQSNVFLVR